MHALDLAGLTAQAQALGLAVRGACAIRAGEYTALPGVPQDGTLVLLGFTGGEQWPAFRASAETRDGAPDALDRWSRRVIDGLAGRVGARAVYPGDRPALPFQQLALRSEPVAASPLGLLLHPRFGLWHAYRGALWFAGVATATAMPLEGARPRPPLCESCVTRPCRSGCPVGAFGAAGFDVAACVAHLQSREGEECRLRGCLARRACPVGAAYRYGDDQQAFHQAAFLRSMHGRAPTTAGD